MALDNFILKSNTGRCKECQKYKGRLTCTVYPTWIPDEAMDEGCPDFEEKEKQASQGNDEKGQEGETTIV